MEEPPASSSPACPGEDKKTVESDSLANTKEDKETVEASSSNKDDVNSQTNEVTTTTTRQEEKVKKKNKYPVNCTVTIPPDRTLGLSLSLDWGNGQRSFVIANMKKYCKLRDFGVQLYDRIVKLNGNAIDTSNYELLTMTIASEERIFGIHQQAYVDKMEKISVFPEELQTSGLKGCFVPSRGPGLIVVAMDTNSSLQLHLQVGDHILTVNGKTVLTLADVSNPDNLYTDGQVNKLGILKAEVAQALLLPPPKETIAAASEGTPTSANSTTPAAAAIEPTEAVRFIDNAASPAAAVAPICNATKAGEPSSAPKEPTTAKAASSRVPPPQHYRASFARQQPPHRAHYHPQHHAQHYNPTTAVHNNKNKNRGPQVVHASATSSTVVLTKYAPPGKVGIVLNSLEKTKEVIVDRINADSPLYGILLPGDKLLEVDGGDVRRWSMPELTRYFTKTASRLRTLKIARTHTAAKHPPAESPDKNQPPPPNNHLVMQSRRPGRVKDKTNQRAANAQGVSENTRPQHLKDNPQQGQPTHNNNNSTSPPNNAETQRAAAPVIDEETKRKFPLLSSYGISLTDENQKYKPSFIRTNLLTELVRWNQKESQKHDVMLGNFPCRLLLFPVGYAKEKKKDLDRDKKMHRIKTYMGTKKLYEEILHCFSKYIEDTEVEAQDLLFEFFARYSPGAYLKHVELAQEERRKEINRTPKPPLVLPDDYVNHDGGDDPKWNLLYTELIAYHKEHGNCLVPSRPTALGRWVSHQRTSYKGKAPSLTPKRIELLEKLDFKWVYDANRPAYVAGGCPRFNKSFAAKIVYPQLSAREALYLGGHTDEEMNVQVDKKHSWRTKYVNLKDKIACRLRAWPPKGPKGGTNKRVQELVDMLKSDDDDRFEKVFGENAHLLEKFLKAAEERKNGGAPQKKRKRSRSTKRSRRPPPEVDTQDSPASSSDDDEEETEEEEGDEPPPPARKQPRTPHSEKRRQAAAVLADQFTERQNYNPYDDGQAIQQRTVLRDHNLEPPYPRAASQTRQQPHAASAAAATATLIGNQFADANQHDHHSNSHLDQLLWRLGQWN